MINLGLCTERRPQILWSEIFFGPFHKTWNLHSSYIYPFWQLVFWPLNDLFWPLLNIFWKSKHYHYYANGIFLPKLFWPIVRKIVIEKNFWNSTLKAKNLQKTECFYNLFLEVSHIYWIGTIRLQIGKILGFRNMQEKLENKCF